MMLLINTLNKCFPEFLLKIYFYTSCFILIVKVCNQKNVMCMINTTYRSHQPNSGLCVNKSKSCSHQLRNEDYNVTNETCSMIFHEKLSPVCESTGILEGKVDKKEEYGKMRLQTYINRHENFNWGPAFNVSFYDFKWKKIYMRFIENQVKNPSLCREFQVIPEISSSFTLYFDCLWNYEIEQKAYHFEYQAFTPSGESFTYKYLFLVPNGEQIDHNTTLENWTIFMVVDVSAMPEKLVLRLQVAPKHLGIRGYKVQVLKTLKENPYILKTEKIYPDPDQVELTFPFETGSRFGKYMFTATPIHDNCTAKNHCITSKTPHILIVEMVEPKFLTGVVMVVILVPIILMGYFIWKRNCENPKEPRSKGYIMGRLSLPMNNGGVIMDSNFRAGTPPGPPKLLLMYSSASVQHVKTMIEIAKYLKRVCGVNALIDELGIPESNHKDPLKWYIGAFSEADYVAIFASPDTTSAEKEEARRFSRYQHKEQIAQNQLSHRLISTETKCKFFSVAIPGTNYDTLPAEAIALKRYLFPRDLDPVLVLVGSNCQCDHGAGFLHAIELATKVEEVELSLPPPVHPPPVAEPPPPVEDEDDGRAPSPCCNTHSASELELVSSKQYQSDTDDSDQSIDHFSLLGE